MSIVTSRVHSKVVGNTSEIRRLFCKGKGGPNMRLAIAGLLLGMSAAVAVAQSSTRPGTSTAPGSTDSSVTGTAPGTPSERPRTQGNVPATTPGGPAAAESSGPDPAKPRTPTAPDKQTPSPR